MKNQVCDVEKHDYEQLIEVWEKSVRATHNFLASEVILQLKPLILNKYFDMVSLKCCKNVVGDIIGFIGVADNKIEMLFILPTAQGQGIGSTLCNYAVENHSVTKVDVNEQNPRAKDFYEKMGFMVVGRSELDAQGKPYPVLHMENDKL